MGAIEFVVGHFLSAFLFYLNHRFVFHSKLGKHKIFKGWRRYHVLHHKYDYTANWRKYILIPWWGWLSFALLATVIGLMTTVYFAVGMLSHVILYEITHYRIHMNPKKSQLAKYHYHHHRHNFKANHVAYWTSIDRIFGSKEDYKGK